MNNNYSNYIKNFKDYLSTIKNLSDLYISNIIGTVNQFLEFVNVYKFEECFSTYEEITLNDIRKISNTEIYSYIFFLAESGYKQSSRNTKIEHLRTFFNFLFNIMHNIFKQPFQIVKTEKRKSFELPNYLSQNEATKLVNLYNESKKTNEIRNNAIINLCLNSGLRVSEVSALNISEINFKTQTFLIHGKGNKERVGYMNDKTQKSIERYLEIRKKITPKNNKDNDALFISNKGGRISVKTIRTAIKLSYTKADINNNTYSVHTLRHTCATLLYKAGIDIKVIQELLGHSDVNTTKIYTHLHDEEVKKQMMEHPLAKYKMKQVYDFCAEQ